MVILRRPSAEKVRREDAASKPTERDFNAWRLERVKGCIAIDYHESARLLKRVDFAGISFLLLTHVLAKEHTLVDFARWFRGAHRVQEHVPGKGTHE